MLKGLIPLHDTYNWIINRKEKAFVRNKVYKNELYHEEDGFGLLFLSFLRI